MAKYSIAVVVILPLMVLCCVKTGCAQLAANLSAQAGATSLSAAGMSADLSASNGPSAPGASSSGNRGMSRAPGILSSPAQSNSLRPRRALFEKQDSALQEYSAPSASGASKPVRLSAQAGFTGLSATHSFGLSKLGNGMAGATSSGSRSTTPQTPLYSFLMRHEKPGSPGTSRQSLSGKGGHGNKSRSSLESLVGAGGGGASHR